MKQYKDNSPTRNVMDIVPGDYVKIGSEWKQIKSNSASGSEHLPKNWDVETTDGGSYGMFSINLYAKKEDMK